MATSKFELRAGVKVRCHSKGVDVDNKNLTDELAEALLAEKPHQIRNFLKYDPAVLKKLDIKDPAEQAKEDKAEKAKGKEAPAEKA